MMGAEGLTNATKYAILNANYMKARFEGHYPILYSGEMGRAAHEMILDRAFEEKRYQSNRYCKTFDGLWIPCANRFFPSSWNFNGGTNRI